MQVAVRNLCRDERIWLLDLPMTPQRQNGLHKGARELAALGLWALAVYTILSLASHDIGRAPNLGGLWVTLWREPWNPPAVM